ncbi:hypothetical protein DES38_104219 [Streptohalobacillus salinus]|uniref:DUF454 domain-containing protein n=1 Tax=Streptohalobacillus salinus TaxID=621096 RepID=A0A2V3WHJ3_9BACI|nr:YbaN family protein [Streptohalobacillus salinus]PXW91785.1 hypothetical protein DES38_104219 [Streptohalobacillus salinus]
MFLKAIYIIMGSISLVLGVIGMVLPVLPTTPFLLLTAYFYVRSSQRLHRWLLNHRIFGAYIRNYIKYRAIPKRTKQLAIVLLWVSMTLTLLIVPLVAVRVMLIIIASIVTFYIFNLRTLTATVIEQRNSGDRE